MKGFDHNIRPTETKTNYIKHRLGKRYMYYFIRKCILTFKFCVSNFDNNQQFFKKKITNVKHKIKTFITLNFLFVKKPMNYII